MVRHPGLCNTVVRDAGAGNRGPLHHRALGLAAIACLLVLTPLAAKAQSAAESFDCLMEPKFQVKLASPAAGVLKDVLVERGSIVRRGQLLAQLEDGVEAAAAALAKAKAEDDSQLVSKEARRNFLERKRGRQEQLRAKGATTETAFDESDSDYRQSVQDLREVTANRNLARLEASRAEEVLRQRSVLSPLDGIVVERSLWRGEYAYDQAPIMTLAQIDPLNVEVYLPIAMYPALKTGMRVEVYPAVPFSERRIATIDVIDSVFDSRSGTFGVRLSLPNPNNVLPAGLRCKVGFSRANNTASGAEQN